MTGATGSKTSAQSDGATPEASDRAGGDLRIVDALIPSDEVVLPARTLAMRFAQVVACQPDAVAILDPNGDTITYAELYRAAGAVAAQLLDRGLGKGAIVLIETARTARTLAAMLGTWMVGAAYVPADPVWPTGRIQQIIDIVHPDLAWLEREEQIRSVDVARIDEVAMRDAANARDHR